MTLVRVDGRGVRAVKKQRLIYDLIDFRDLETGITSMQRTVDFTLSLGVRLILERRIHQAGLLTLMDVPYEDVFPALEKHNIRVTRSIEEAPMKSNNQWHQVGRGCPPGLTSMRYPQ